MLRRPPRVVGGLRASLRVPLRWPGVCPSGRCLPRPKVGSHTRRLLALPTVFLQKVAQGHRFLASAGRSAARGPLPLGTVFLRAVARRPLWLRLRLSRGRSVAHFENRLWPANVSVQAGLAL